MNNRKNLISMIRGKRGGYWIEKVATDDGTAYQLHTPKDGDTHAPLLPCTWAAVVLDAARVMTPAQIEAPPIYDDGRKHNGKAMDVEEMQTLLKWAL